MASKVDWLPIDDVVEDILDRRGVTPLKLGGDFTQHGHRVISAKIIKGGRIQLDAGESRFIDSTIYRKWMKVPLRQGDVVMTSEAPLGELAYLRDSVDWALGQRLFAIRTRSKVLDGRFLYYALMTAKVRDDIAGRASGTTVQGIRQSELRRVKVPVPPLPVQIAVATTLGALDDRIDLLRKTNTTLEAIAQALFKSWFVDFDPARAKTEGLAPVGMDVDTAALFPSELAESELGLIPKGWRTGTFGSIAHQSKGNVNPLNSPETVFDHYSLPAFDAGLMPVRELGEAIKSNKTPVPNDAVLISKLNPHIPRIWFTGEVRPNAVCSTEFLVWKPADGVPAEYIFCLATSTPFNTAMKQLVTGTSSSHQRVKPDYLAAISAVVPPPEITTAFGRIAGPLLRRVLENRSIAKSLAQLRDTLLPRLISGKLSMPEAESLIEDAVA